MKKCNPRITNFICVALGCLLLAARAEGAAVSFAGADTSTNDAWRTTDLVKPFDIDGDNVYGTDGYEISSWNTSLAASYASVVVNAPFSFDGGAEIPSYYPLDDPAGTGPAPVVNDESGVQYYSAVAGTPEQDFYTITLTQNADFRLGVMVDNGDFLAISPSSLRVRQTVGGSGDSGLVLVTDRDFDADYFFFDVKGAGAGDVFVVSGVQDPNMGSNGLAGITLDSFPVPEPSTLALFSLGLMGQTFRRRRRR